MTMWRSPKYRMTVASLPCVFCGNEGRCQAAHGNSAAWDKGRGLKAHDWATFPACAAGFSDVGCHARFDQKARGLSKEQRIEQDAVFILNTMQKLLGAGQLRIRWKKGHAMEAAQAMGQLFELGVLKV